MQCRIPQSRTNPAVTATGLFSVVRVVISILRLPHVPCMCDTFPCVCKYVVLSNTDLNIRYLSVRIWPAGTGHSVLLLLSSPSIRRTVVLVSSSPSGHRPVCILLLSSSHSGRHILVHVVVIYTVSEIIHVAYCTASV